MISGKFRKHILYKCAWVLYFKLNVIIEVFPWLNQVPSVALHIEIQSACPVLKTSFRNSQDFERVNLLQSLVDWLCHHDPVLSRVCDVR